MNLAKFWRTTFLQNISGRLLLLLDFQRQPPEVFHEKRCSWKFPKIYRKTPLVCEIAKNTFLTEHPGTTASGSTNNVWENSGEYSLPRNTNLRSTVQVYHFFLGSINFQCMFSLVYIVYRQKQPSEQRRSVKKGVLKDFVNFIGKHLCWSFF